MTPELLAQIAELLGQSVEHIQSLTLEEIDELLVSAFTESAEPEEGEVDMDRLRTLRDARVGVKAAITEAEAAEAAQAAEIESLKAEMTETAETEPDGEGGDDTPAEGEDSTDGTPAETPAEAPAPEETPAPAEAEAPVAVAASTEPRRIVAMPRRRPAAHAPVPTEDSNGMVSITAAADVRGYSAGAPIKSLRDLGMAFVDRVEGLRGAQGISGKVPVATMHLNYPEDRVLVAGADDQNLQKIEAVRAIAAGATPESLTAAGGLCAPVAVRYEFENVSVDDRPVRDSMVRFNAERGGINVPTGPTITSPDAGVDVITETEDTEGTTKPCVTITCPSYSEVDISAVYQCLQIGNFSRRTFPELFAQWWAKASALHARKAEGALLDAVGGIATNVTDGQNLGAFSDIVESINRARVERINFHRASRNLMFDWLAPEWLLGLIKSDMFRRHAGGPNDNFLITDAYIESVLRNIGINPVWYKDTETGEGMIYAQQGVQAILGWNTNPVTYLYPTGSFLFLDGGTLDLGTEIRDTTMNEGNNVRAFTETFENAAFVGDITPLEITHAICISGAGSLDIAVSCVENS